MSLPIFMHVKTYISPVRIIAFVLFGLQVAQAWQIDLSRRRQQLVRQEASVPTESRQEPGLMEKVFTVAPKQEIVILNTEKGFVPNVVRVASGSKYKVHVVNVNKSNQNVSFVMDYFGEHHGTFYGQVKSFELDVKKEGVFAYQCPEMGFEGRFVSFSSDGKTAPLVPGPDTKQMGATTVRDLASEPK